MGPVPLLMGPFGNTEVETGEIDKNKCIRLKGFDVFFTKGKVTENLRQVGQDFEKTHKGHFLVMLYERAAGLLHAVPAPAADHCPGIVPVDGPDQVGAVKVS